MPISDDEVMERYPWGAIDHDNKAQWKGYLEHRLLVGRCTSCGYLTNPLRPMCPKCWSEDMALEEVSGKGRVQWFTLLHQGAPAGADPSTPYPVVTVELDEQPNLRFSSTVVHCAPEEITIDMPVVLTWVEREGAPLPAFEPLR